MDDRAQHSVGQQREMNQKAMLAMDQVQQRFGVKGLQPASLLAQGEMVEVISPAWKGSGHRQSLRDTPSS